MLEEKDGDETLFKFELKEANLASILDKVKSSGLCSLYEKCDYRHRGLLVDGMCVSDAHRKQSIPQHESSRAPVRCHTALTHTASRCFLCVFAFRC